MKKKYAPASEKQKMDLDYLALRKAELRREISLQKQKIGLSAEYLFSFEGISGYLIKTFFRGSNLLEGLLSGFRFVKNIKRILRILRK